MNVMEHYITSKAGTVRCKKKTGVCKLHRSKADNLKNDNNEVKKKMEKKKKKKQKAETEEKNRFLIIQQRRRKFIIGGAALAANVKAYLITRPHK
jgi:UDP-N-acetylmuramoylalanine-D-glutamate ligase